jgi:hypothetical protein
VPKPNASKPKTEVWYCWMEYATVEGEKQPRLLLPWGNPFKYEFPFDFLYKSKAAARKAKQEQAPDEDWVLCKKTIEAV